MIGIDVVEIARIQKLDMDGFANKILCQSEKAYLETKLRKAETLAGFFAAKEAVSKALGSGFTKDVTHKDIEVLHDENGAPICNLHGKAKEILMQKGKEIYISVSHDGGYAAAAAFIK